MSRTLIIFDCDGTLVDSQNAIFAAMTEAFTGLGLTPPARRDVLSIVGLSLPEAFAALAPTQSATAQQELAQRYREAFPQMRLRTDREEPLFPGTREIIAGYAAEPRVALGIATGKSKRGVERLFVREAWHTAFETVQTADDHPSKPHPSMILTAMAETACEAQRTVMVGDTSFDMAMARAAGVLAVGVSWGYHPAVDLRHAGAHTIIDAFEELPAVITQLLTGA